MLTRPTLTGPMHTGPSTYRCIQDHVALYWALVSQIALRVKSTLNQNWTPDDVCPGCLFPWMEHLICMLRWRP
jgi:hypothetical protein